jgi:dTDP-4-amino-4,6-dideoxygalactose transaminase
MVDVVGQYQRIKREVDEAVHRVLDSGQYILGKDVGEFECSVAGYLGVRYAVGCASGTDALLVAMMALGIGPGDEVITTPFTFVATTETIVLLGADPVYVDIDPGTFNIDPGKVERAITHKTKAILPVHLYGQATDMDPIMDIAQRHDLKVIEDAAQAIGASYKRKKVGSIGNVGCISFFPSKNLGSCGDAGMVVTNDSALGERMRMIVVHGSRKRYHHEILGLNSRLDTLQAAILKVKLQYLDEWNAARRRFAGRYDELLNGAPVTTPRVSPSCEHIFHQYTIRAPKRDALSGYLKDKGIPHGIYYPIPLYRQKAYASIIDQRLNFPQTEQAANEVLSLPMHTELNDDQLQFITGTIKEFYAVS